MNRPGENGERVGARLVPRDQSSPTTLVDAIRAQALDGEFDPPPSPQNEEAGGGSRSSRDRSRIQTRDRPLTPDSSLTGVIDVVVLFLDDRRAFF